MTVEQNEFIFSYLLLTVMEQNPKFLSDENLTSFKSANQKMKSDLENLIRIKSWKRNAAVQTDFDGAGSILYLKLLFTVILSSYSGTWPSLT